MNRIAKILNPPGRGLTALSKKADEANAISKHLALKRLSDRAPKEVRGSYKHSPRKREPNEALPQTSDRIRVREYIYGDGDPQALTMQRPGSDHSHLKSRGWI